MTLAFDSASLAVFTTLAPAGMVAFAIMALLRATVPDPAHKRLVDHLLAIPFLLVLSGFITSTAHLGTPSNALYVITGVGRSPLSNEVASSLTFLFLSGSYWMIAISRNLPIRVSRLWLAAASVAAVIALGFTAVVYSIETIPTWNTVYTPIALIAGALGVGSLLAEGVYLFVGNRDSRRSVVLLGMCVLSFAIMVIALALLRFGISSIESFIVSADALAHNYGLVLAVCAISCLGAFAAASIASFRKELATNVRIVLVVISVLFALWGVFVARCLFYQLYMTVGV